MPGSVVTVRTPMYLWSIYQLRGSRLDLSVKTKKRSREGTLEDTQRSDHQRPLSREGTPEATLVEGQGRLLAWFS